jgi:Leucine-rich repeat (LRR) protein
MRKILFRRGLSRLNAFMAALLLAYVVASYPAPAVAAIPHSEREALIAIYNSMGGGGWGNETGWLDPPGSECSWYGVSCDAAQTTVTGLDLSRNNLAGIIPAEVADLVSLQATDLSSRSLEGSIPPGVGTLKQLRSLRLSAELDPPVIVIGPPLPIGLTGSIPPELGNLTNLEVLDLGGNQFSSSIPIELGNLIKLRVLNIAASWSYGQLAGSIPATLGNLRNLETLLLSRNKLSGSIPPELGNLTKLQSLKLGYNDLTGNIPAELGNLTNLEVLDLSGNPFSGSIPIELGNLTNLQALLLGDNSLSGSIPAQLGNLRNLERLSLYHNDLSGEIPAALGNLTTLRTLDLGGNSLSGSIPAQLGNLRNLERLSLYHNDLSGEIPAALGNLTTLRTLVLDGNSLSGRIPAALGNLANLLELRLYNNSLSGSIPAELGNLTTLLTLDLGGNSLSGRIPAALGNLANLHYLRLKDNSLSGSIPAELGNLAKLDVLDLQKNSLSGSIPAELGNLANLFALHLEQNSLSGSIPPYLGNMPNLLGLFLSSNQLSGEIPSTFHRWDYPSGGLEIRYNALYTSDPTLKSLLDRKDPGWDLTQTVAPSQISATPFSSSSVLLSWKPIPFTDYGGRYEVWLCASDGKPFPRLGSTADKKSSSLALNFFHPGTTYSLAVRTVSGPNPSNQNTVTSDFSAPISFKMPEISIDLTLNGAGAATATTFGSTGAVQAGYAVASVSTGSTPYATALISYQRNGATVSEVGIPASPPTSSARFFVDYRTDTTLPGSDTKVEIYTGFAAVNRGNGPASLSFILRDPEGQIISRGTGSLDKDAHLAAYFNQLPDILPGFSIDPSFPSSTHFGTLELSSDQPLSILALRLTTNQRGEMLMTSTPIADLARPSTGSPIYFPQLADGAGYSTTVVLLNTSSVVETGVLHLFAIDGSPLTVRQVNGSSASSFNYSIPPGGVYVFQTDASPQDVQTGWVELIPEGGTITPAGAGILQFSRDGVLVTETGIPSVAPTTHARIFLDTSGGHNTGMAIGNPGIAPLNLSLQAFQMDGTTQAGATNGPIALDAREHAASFVDQLISGLPSGFQGVLDITGDSPFAAITYRSLVNERGEILLTAFPVADLNQPPPSPILFPQIADGDGFSTEFILLSASGPSSTTLSFFGETGAPLAVGKW